VFLKSWCLRQSGNQRVESSVTLHQRRRRKSESYKREQRLNIEEGISQCVYPIHTVKMLGTCASHLLGVHAYVAVPPRWWPDIIPLVRIPLLDMTGQNPSCCKMPPGQNPSLFNPCACGQLLGADLRVGPETRGPVFELLFFTRFTDEFSTVV